MFCMDDKHSEGFDIARHSDKNFASGMLFHYSRTTGCGGAALCSLAY